MFRNSAFVLGACLATAHVSASAEDPRSTAKANAFNPRISLVLQGTYADFARDEEPEVPGVLLGPETELRPAGFSLSETELVAEANVDDLFRGWVTIALENENGETVVAVEEAYVNTLGLPGGFQIKAGRMFSDIGYLNRVHGHAWEFVDQPLVYRALLANHLVDDGVQVRWVAPTDLFLEIGTEALRGQGFPAGGELRDGANTYTGFVHVGGDVGTGGAWRLGASHLNMDADGRQTGEHDSPETFGYTGSSELSILDFVFKWAQDGDPAKRNIVVNAEYFTRDEAGEVSFDDGANPTVTSAYDGAQDGYYVQAIVQLIPRWRAGIRYDSLEADNAVANNPGGEFDTLADSTRATRSSVMVDYSRSEFSRIRLQYNRDESRPGGVEDDQFFVQYVMSVGSHPAHYF